MFYRTSSKGSKNGNEFLQYHNKPHSDTCDNYDLIPFKPKKGTKSKAWTYFHIYKSNSKEFLPSTCDPSEGECANCNICGTNIIYKRNYNDKPSSSTSGLISHLARHKIFFSKTDPSQKRSISEIFSSSKKPKYSCKNQKHEHINQKTIEWICMDLQPISCIESTFFRDMMLVNNPGYQNIGRKNVVKKIHLLEDEIRSYISNLIKKDDPWFSITVDHWTSVANQNYTGMTIHWVDHLCEMNNLMLGCWLHEGDSKATSLVDDFVTKLFKKCDLTTAKLSAVVTDTTGNMNLFGKMLEELDIPHIYCTDHVLQCTAKMAFRDTAFNNYVTSNTTLNVEPEVEKFELMKKCRDLVKLFTKSSQKQDLLLQQQQKMVFYRNRSPVKCVQDVVTRWWSTYSMLDRLFYLKPAIEGLKADNQIPENLALEDMEWKIIQQIISVLKPFKMAQKHLEGEKYVTMSYIPMMINFIENKLQGILADPTTNNNVKSLVNSMIIDFQIRWGNTDTPKFNPKVIRGFYNRQVGFHPVTVMTTALDPRLKNLSFIINQEEKENVWAYVLETMKNEFKNTNKQNHLSLTKNHSVINKETISCDMDSDTEDFFDSLQEAQNLRHNSEYSDLIENDTITQVCIQELNGYKQCKLLEIYIRVNGKKKVNSPLKKFWYINKERFPILYTLALKYMCIPATSAPSERVFSVASKILTKFRNRLDPDTAGSILFIQGSLPWYKKQIQNETN